MILTRILDGLHTMLNKENSSCLPGTLFPGYRCALQSWYRTGGRAAPMVFKITALTLSNLPR